MLYLQGINESCWTTDLSVTFEEVLRDERAKLSSSSLLKQELNDRVAKKLSSRLQDLEGKSTNKTQGWYFDVCGM